MRKLLIVLLLLPIVCFSQPYSDGASFIGKCFTDTVDVYDCYWKTVILRVDGEIINCEVLSDSVLAATYLFSYRVNYRHGEADTLKWINKYVPDTEYWGNSKTYFYLGWEEAKKELGMK